MKIELIGREAMREIAPAALVAFASYKGWVRGEPFGDHADVYYAEGHPEVILPRTNRLADYERTVAELVRIFATASGTDDGEIVRQLLESDKDVVRVRAPRSGDDGSIALDEGVELIARSRDLLLAAACSLGPPRHVYRSGANREATDIIGRFRLGQTEFGSYVITMSASIPPALNLQLPLSATEEDQLRLETAFAPDERRVVSRLFETLRAAREAAEATLAGEQGAFERAVPKGVSANLCEAVSALVRNSGGIEISAQWARTRPLRAFAPKIRFTESDAGILAEAARAFRERQPRPDAELHGSVLRAKRDQSEVDGLVTLKVAVDDRFQSVTAVLDPENYSIALRANDQRARIKAVGDLLRVGSRWSLSNAMITIIRDEDEAAVEPGDGAPSGAHE